MSRARLPLWRLIVLVAVAMAPPPMAAPPALAARPPEPAGAGNLVLLERVWEAAQRSIHPGSLVDGHFTPAARRALEADARRAPDLYAFAPALDRFLRSLGRSHAGFYTDRTVDFHLYRAMFTTRSLDQPALWHAGLQHRRVDGEWRVREVWDGYPAARAGLRRGDVLVAADGAPYVPFAAFNDRHGAPVAIELRRGGRRHTVTVAPVHENPNRSLLRAMQHSVRVVEGGQGQRIGYLHLWAGTHGDMLRAYLAALERLAGCDALIVDLRGGFGGAWYEYLDPFFLDRSGYFQATVVSRQGEERLPVGERTDVPYFPQPMVVLINEGTRSGKEALAFQFRKSGRARLVGTRTRGAFAAGQAFFTEPAAPYVMMLPVAEYLLDGQVIEGVGVHADVTLADPVDGSAPDPQLQRALQLAAELASR